MEPTYNFDDHFKKLLKNLFGDMDEALLKQIFESGKKTELNSGDYLFKQGDGNNELFIVLSGRLRALNQDSAGTAILGDIGAGEPVGEIALFTNEPRMASIVAMRKSLVLEISQEMYGEIVRNNPGFAASLTRFVINRLRRNLLQQNLQASPSNIALINMHDSNPVGELAEGLKEFLGKDFISTKVFHKEKYGPDGLTEELENHKGVNLMLCSGKDQAWTKQCLLHADLIVLLADAEADPSLHPVEESQELYGDSVLNKKTYLVLLHDEDSKSPRGTIRWLKPRNVNLHVHVRKKNAKDLRRLCRIITNRAVGLVLGGSGIKGYAHVGAVKALLKSGMEIDFVGGTSAGALYGMAMTYADFDFEKVDTICRQSVENEEGINDFFLNFFSKDSEKDIASFVENIFKDTQLEDFWINSYCVSTSISNSEVRVHTKGPVWKQVQASFALPGIFPPVVIDNQVYVDGGVSDNIPVDPMYRYPIKHIVAISLTGSEPQKVEAKDVSSAWSQLKETFAKKKKYDSPALTSVMVNSMTFNSRQKEEITKSKVSLYFEMNLGAVSLLDDSKWEKVVKKGYDQTRDFLTELKEEEKFWS
jgi:NTE family protein